MVLLEAADESPGGGIDAVAFRRMVAAWASTPPAALYSATRYALQVSVGGHDPQEALATALGLWSDALGRVGLPAWRLVRAEIMTPEEFERDLATAECAVPTGELSTRAMASGGDPDSDDLLRRALHDPVTGLPERELFLDDVREVLSAAGGSAIRAVMVVDVDGLDVPAPEHVLVELAARLKDAVRREDLVGRAGPARFALLVTVPSGEDTDAVARRIVTNVRSPVLDDGPALEVTASVGVARPSPGADADDLVLMAELAVTAARNAGGNCHRQYAAHPDSV